MIYSLQVRVVTAQVVGTARIDSAATGSGTTVLKGVVWQAPPSFDAAERDLMEMRESGVAAVRTGIIRNHRLLSLADTIGLTLYIDLPIVRMPASRLRDTLNYASALLDTVAGLAQIHSSIQAIGLARYADTSDSTSCAYFDALDRQANEIMPVHVQTYYLTRFLDEDRCSGDVDFVLADMRDMDNPVRRLRTSRKAGSTIGIGALGVWVRPDTVGGLDVPGSLESQARYLENALPILLSDT
ncbi:MAG: hypothetical protein WD275_03500, partial [Rhodothermales bacterium]